MSVNAASLVSEIRARRELSMNTLAMLAGVPASTISRIESGKIDPTLSMLDRIADAVGYSLAPALAESGGDEPFARALRKLEEVDANERRALITRFPAVALLAPVARRTGAVRVDVQRGLKELLSLLEHSDQEVVVSSLEALSDETDVARSFVPVVYVTDPSAVSVLSAASPSSPQVAFLLPITDNVRRFARVTPNGAMVTPEWGLLDALASPGRQADVARSALDALIDAAAAA
ncbi:helix-turn-helix transcriptional regulator [Microbacterium terrisoli]|uniref:helix-turn-helix transcriptional regulator n=1 Tax=Microbacterium terrisoli TaxID=3242192 RepID=UPI002805AFB2|nr:helix-turn-helix transcriptional regulator [Microbacterium protaetiae]